MARATPQKAIRRLAEASKVVNAVTGLLEYVASLLRQLVHVVGWLVLLSTVVTLLIHPHLDLAPQHLVVPGSGALAVLQSMIKPARRDGSDAVTPGDLSHPDDDLCDREGASFEEVDEIRLDQADP